MTTEQLIEKIVKELGEEISIFYYAGNYLVGDGEIEVDSPDLNEALTLFLREI